MVSSKKGTLLEFLFCITFYVFQKVHLLVMRKTIEEHTPKGAKNTFGTLQNKNVPFDVFLH